MTRSFSNSAAAAAGALRRLGDVCNCFSGSGTSSDSAADSGGGAASFVGVADSEAERYRLHIDAERVPAASRAFTVRVTDAAGNLGGDMWVLEDD